MGPAALTLPVTLRPCAQVGPATAEPWGGPVLQREGLSGEMVLVQLMRVRIPLQWRLEADLGPAQARLLDE